MWLFGEPPNPKRVGNVSPLDLSLMSKPMPLAEFERRYEVEFGTNYLAILDQEMEELPVVEF